MSRVEKIERRTDRSPIVCDFCNRIPDRWNLAPVCTTSYAKENPASKLRKLSQPKVDLCSCVVVDQSHPELSLATICAEVYANTVEGVPDDAAQLLSFQTMQKLKNHPVTRPFVFLMKTTGKHFRLKTHLLESGFGHKWHGVNSL